MKSQLPPFYQTYPLLPARGLASWLVSTAVEGWDGLLTHPLPARPPGPAAHMIKCTYGHMHTALPFILQPPGLARRPANGRITCAEARRHGIAPVHSDHQAYEFMRDGDGDGVVCE